MSKLHECPQCEGRGWYPVPVGIYGDSEQVQCERCEGTGRVRDLDACCPLERRDFNGGCINCGDTCF